MQTLWRHALVDEFTALIFPIVLGQGKRVFGDGVAPAGLKLVSAVAHKTGVVVAKYEMAGAVKTGDFQLPDPNEAEIERRQKLS